MSGAAVARFVKSVWSNRDFTYVALPFLGYIYLQQEKQFAFLREHDKLVKSNVDDLRAKGFIRVQ